MEDIKKMNDIYKWKKISYLTVKFKIEDWFYAKTPDVEKNFPFSPNAKFTLLDVLNTRHTVEMESFDEKEIPNIVNHPNPPEDLST